jgi:hypothetical protein
MSGVVLNSADTGIEVIDLQSDPAFAARRLHTRDVAMQMEGMRRLTRAFVEDPDTILQQLVNAAVELCGADSAGITLEQTGPSDALSYKWVATSGQYADYVNATLPPEPNPCHITLERGAPQIVRVTQPFFDMLGVNAPLVTDGMLLPWHVEETRGTVWIVAHGRTEAFDGDDCRMMQVLADFAAMGIRHQRQQKLLMQQAGAAAAADMANHLAHRINNPLQSLTNIVFLAAHDDSGGDARKLAGDLGEHIQRLSVLAGQLLTLPSAANRQK